MRSFFTIISKSLAFLFILSALTRAHATPSYIKRAIVNMNIAQEVSTAPRAISNMISGRSIFVPDDKLVGFYFYFSPKGEVAMTTYKRRPQIGQLLQKVAIGRWKAKRAKLCLDISRIQAMKAGSKKGIKHCFKTRIMAYPRFDSEAGKWKPGDLLLYIGGTHIKQIYKGDPFQIGQALVGGTIYEALEAKHLVFSSKIMALQKCTDKKVKKTAYQDFFEGIGTIDCPAFRNYVARRHKACKKNVESAACLGIIGGIMKEIAGKFTSR